MSTKTLIFAFLNSFAWVSILGLAMAQNGPNAGSNNNDYLALGDSVPFGYNPLVQPPDLSDYFGYPSIISAIIQNSLANASCPFETTATFLFGGTTADGVFGCQVWRTMSGLKKPLFVSYSGPQIEYATAFLQSHPNTHIVTIQLGGNDLADLQLMCKGDPTCELPNLPGTLAQVTANLGTAIARLRGTGYSGPIVLVNYYAFNYTNQLQTAGFGALASTIATVAAASPNVEVADAFKAFRSGECSVQRRYLRCRTAHQVEQFQSANWGHLRRSSYVCRTCRACRSGFRGSRQVEPLARLVGLTRDPHLDRVVRRM